MHPIGKVGAFVTLLAQPLCTAHAQDSAASTSTALQEVIVWGRSERLLGSAGSASEGVVGYADFSTRPLQRVAELTEVVPGMVATAHAGSGKANQYFLRGINLDHGTDFAAYFDGVPINLRSHAHAQGYLDLNFMIPEIIRTVDYYKGTHHTEFGDFSAAGAAKFSTYDRLPRGFLEARLGAHDEYRVVGAQSLDLRSGTVLYAAEAEFADGPWKLAQDGRRFNGFGKYSDRSGEWDRSLEMMVYTNEWRSTDQIPQRAVDAGLLSRYGYVDPDLGGESTRIHLAGRLQSETWTLVGYGTYYSLNLFSNPTYALADPEHGDEIEQQDRRWIGGASAKYQNVLSLADRPLSYMLGADVRYDDVGALGLFNTVKRRRVRTVRADTVQELSAGMYANAELRWTDRFRTSAGVRGDFYRYEVDSNTRSNSGHGTDSIFSPKLSAAYVVTPQVELYANAGLGFHSNDVRGVTITVDPVSGAPAQAVPALVRAKGAELGMRWERGEQVRLAVTHFWLEMDSELAFVGDAGTSEPKGASKRRGVEVAGFWQPVRPLVFDFTAAWTHARYTSAAGGGRYIPNAHESVLGAGATLALTNGFTASLRVRHLGPAPLIEDNSVRESSSTLINLGASYAWDRWQLGLEVLNLLDRKTNDIAYYFESQLPWETQPVEDVHFHPAEPREMRASVTVKF